MKQCNFPIQVRDEEKTEGHNSKTPCVPNGTGHTKSISEEENSLLADSVPSDEDASDVDEYNSDAKQD